MSDIQLDDFVMFRYEMNTIFKKKEYLPEKEKSEFYYGYNPLSKIGGQLVKDLGIQEKKQKIDLYRPPGRIVPIETIHKQKSYLGEIVWNAIPHKERI